MKLDQILVGWDNRQKNGNNQRVRQHYFYFQKNNSFQSSSLCTRQIISSELYDMLGNLEKKKKNRPEGKERKKKHIRNARFYVTPNIHNYLSHCTGQRQGTKFFFVFFTFILRVIQG